MAWDAKIAKAVVRAASEDSWFWAILNGVSLWLPRNAIIMMAHCVQGIEDNAMIIQAETHHALWMRSKLNPSGVFLDVGAAVGQMSVTTALASGARIFAFEPARQQRALLEAIIARNGTKDIVVVPAAVSDKSGTATFAECALNEDQEIAIAPETSALANRYVSGPSNAYDVPVITVDEYCTMQGLFGTPAVVKIDVEGFETHVLRGAKNYLAQTRPHLSIDIHRDPFSEGTTEQGVRSCLAELHYQIETAGHVLLCSPSLLTEAVEER